MEAQFNANIPYFFRTKLLKMFTKPQYELLVLPYHHISVKVLHQYVCIGPLSLRKIPKMVSPSNELYQGLIQEESNQASAVTN